MKKTLIIAAVVLFLGSVGFLYIKHDLLKARDFKPDKSKAETIFDLRPAIIAKLQQVVKDASDGLYILSVDKIEPDIVSSKLDLVDGSISVDTATLVRLDKSKKLPDDILRVKFHSLHIDGIGITDLLHKNSINVTNAYLSDPIITIYHRARPYNSENRKENDSLTLYQRLMGQMKKIAINALNINRGVLIIHDVEQHDRVTRLNDITIKMSNILIDSSTQYDATRFLFAKHAVLETRNYVFRTPDSLYFLKLGKISFVGETHTVTVLNARLQHRGTRQQFEKKLPGRDQMYDVVLPRVVLSAVNWLELVNRTRLVVAKTQIYGGTVSVFSDKSLPLGAQQPMNHFPHQLVMKIPIPVFVNQLDFQQLKVVFRQYNPETRSTGTVVVTDIKGNAKHITNIPAEIKKLTYTFLSAKGLLSDKVPFGARFKFDLAHYLNGQFSVDVYMDSLNKDIVNPMAEPLGRFTVKSGEMQHGTTHLEGDNFHLGGTMQVRYTDLHLIPLKSDSARGELKKNHLKSFFANIIFIKNENPMGSELRQPTFTVGRDHHQNFVGYIWTAILTGLCKTIGVPVKLVVKDN